MKINYKEYELEVFRDGNMVSDDALFSSIVRKSDGYLIYEDVSYRGNSVREEIQFLKNIIDNDS